MCVLGGKEDAYCLCVCDFMLVRLAVGYGLSLEAFDDLLN